MVIDKSYSKWEFREKMSYTFTSSKEKKMTRPKLFENKELLDTY